MPSAYTTLAGLFTAIADALRAKTGGADPIPAQSFPAAVAALPTGLDTSDATAGAGDILAGKTAYADGAKLTGTVPSLAAATVTPGTAAQTIAAGQYLAGAQTVEGDADLTAGNIKSGVSIFGVAGTLSALTPEPVYAANLTSSFVSSNTWNYTAAGNRVTDVYKVKAGRPYLLCLGAAHRNRFLAALFDTDVMEATANVTGTALTPSGNNSVSYDSKSVFVPASDGTLGVTKSYNDPTGAQVPTYLLDLSSIVL